MTFSVTVVDSQHRPDLFAEVERDGELALEVFVSEGKVCAAIIGSDGRALWESSVEDIRDALTRAEDALSEFGLA